MREPSQCIDHGIVLLRLLPYECENTAIPDCQGRGQDQICTRHSHAQNSHRRLATEVLSFVSHCSRKNRPTRQDEPRRQRTPPQSVPELATSSSPRGLVFLAPISSRDPPGRLLLKSSPRLCVRQTSRPSANSNMAAGWLRDSVDTGAGFDYEHPANAREIKPLRLLALVTKSLKRGGKKVCGLGTKSPGRKRRCCTLPTSLAVIWVMVREVPAPYISWV